MSYLSRAAATNLLAFMVLWLLFCGQTAQSQPSPRNAADSLRILSWNVYMLSAITNLSAKVHRSYKVKRAEAIAKVLIREAYDVVVLNEAFHRRGRNVLQKKLHKLYPYAYGPINKKLGIKTNGGVMLFSKQPLDSLATIRYKDCDIEDCMSRKGAISAMGKHGKHRYQIVGTHMQSDATDYLRHQQAKQLYQQLLQPQQAEGVLQIIAGDFNMDYQNTADFKLLIQELGADPYTPLAGDAEFSFPSTKQIFDYIFTKTNHAPIYAVQQRIRKWEEQWGKNGEKWLSDHYAIEAIIFFEP